MCLICWLASVTKGRLHSYSSSQSLNRQLVSFMWSSLTESVKIIDSLKLYKKTTTTTLFLWTERQLNFGRCTYLETLSCQTQLCLITWIMCGLQIQSVLAHCSQAHLNGVEPLVMSLVTPVFPPMTSQNAVNKVWKNKPVFYLFIYFWNNFKTGFFSRGFYCRCLITYCWAFKPSPFLLILLIPCLFT